MGTPCSLLLRLRPMGMSSDGLASKKPNGLRKKPTCSAGMTGQSSMRGMWVTPKECHSTQSASTRLRSCRQDIHHVTGWKALREALMHACSKNKLLRTGPNFKLSYWLLLPWNCHAPAVCGCVQCSTHNDVDTVTDCAILCTDKHA